MATMPADITVIRQLIPMEIIKIVDIFQKDWIGTLCLSRANSGADVVRLNEFLLPKSLEDWFSGKLAAKYAAYGIELSHMERILIAFAENVSAFFDANPQGLTIAQDDPFRHVLCRDEQGFYLPLRG